MKKGYFRLTCVAQKRCCLSSLILGAKNEERESKTAKKMVQVKERGGVGKKGRKLPSPSPHFHLLALVSFLAQPKPRIPFLGLTLLQNQTETLATQAIFLRTQSFIR